MKAKRITALIAALTLTLLTWLPALADGEAYGAYYIIADSDVRRLSENELWNYTRETLRYIRNELLARHGYVFGDNKFGRHFRTKSWYSEGGYENAVLSGIEWDNINLVKKVERLMDKMGTENSNQLDIATIQYNQMNNTCPGR